jgi:hypothetical protein
MFQIYWEINGVKEQLCIIQYVYIYIYAQEEKKHISKEKKIWAQQHIVMVNTEEIKKSPIIKHKKQSSHRTRDQYWLGYMM